jgi:hypothetical protein
VGQLGLQKRMLLLVTVWDRKEWKEEDAVVWAARVHDYIQKLTV